MSEFQTRGRTGPDKAVNFALYAKEHGWGGKWAQDQSTGVTHLQATRGDNETIDIWWQSGGGVTSAMLPMYTLNGEKIKCRNVSAAAQIVAKEPDESRVRKTLRRKSVNGSAPNELHKTDKYITMADDELEKLVFGRTVTWVNGISGELQSAEAGGKKTLKVVRAIEDGHRDQLHFVDSFGFHAVYLDAIVSVR